MTPTLFTRAARQACLAGLLLAATVPAAHAADSTLIKIDNFVFTPDHLTVAPGTVVTFRNDDDIPHLVVATDHSFRSPALDTGGSYSVTITKPGQVSYFCGLHPHMQGSITVVP